MGASHAKGKVKGTIDMGEFFIDVGDLLSHVRKSTELFNTFLRDLDLWTENSCFSFMKRDARLIVWVWLPQVKQVATSFDCLPFLQQVRYAGDVSWLKVANVGNLRFARLPLLLFITLSLRSGPEQCK